MSLSHTHETYLVHNAHDIISAAAQLHALSLEYVNEVHQRQHQLGGIIQPALLDDLCTQRVKSEKVKLIKYKEY